MKWEKYAKIFDSKFWFLVVVQVMGVNIKLQEVRAHWYLWQPTSFALFLAFVNTCLTIFNNNIRI